MSPLHPRQLIEETVRAVAAKSVVFVHWDDFFRPLERPIGPYFVPPRRRGVPFRRANVNETERLLREPFGGRVEFVVPEPFRWYRVTKDGAVRGVT